MPGKYQYSSIRNILPPGKFYHLTIAYMFNQASNILFPSFIRSVLHHFYILLSENIPEKGLFDNACQRSSNRPL